MWKLRISQAEIMVKKTNNDSNDGDNIGLILIIIMIIMLIMTVTLKLIMLRILCLLSVCFLLITDFEEYARYLFHDSFIFILYKKSI